MSGGTVAISDLGRVVTGKTPSTKNAAFFDGEYQFVTPSDLDWKTYYCHTTERTVTDDARKSHLNQFIPSDAVMVTCIGNTIGKCGLSVSDCLTNQQINTIIPSGGIDPRFVYYLLVHNTDTIRGVGLGGGSATPILNKTSFSKIKLRVPPQNQWGNIASTLSAYDDLIENNRRRIQLLEQAARLLYKEWFVHLRFPGHEHTQIIDGVPEGWEKKKIAEVCETIGGGTPSTKVSEYWDGDITWVVPSDITNNNSLILLKSERKITEKGLRESSAKLVPAESILMTSRASVGFFALMDHEVCTNQGFINIVPHDNQSRMYLLFNLLSRVNEIRSNAKGTTYPEISKGRFREMDITIPSKILMEQFGEIAYDVIRQVRCLMRSNMNLTKARDLLLPKLMNGEVAV
jgi:type I restriction enzyme S subunit